MSVPAQYQTCKSSNEVARYGILIQGAPGTRRRIGRKHRRTDRRASWRSGRRRWIAEYLGASDREDRLPSILALRMEKMEEPSEKLQWNKFLRSWNWRSPSFREQIQSPVAPRRGISLGGGRVEALNVASRSARSNVLDVRHGRSFASTSDRRQPSEQRFTESQA